MSDDGEAWRRCLWAQAGGMVQSSTNDCRRSDVTDPSKSKGGGKGRNGISKHLLKYDLSKIWWIFLWASQPKSKHVDLSMYAKWQELLFASVEVINDGCSLALLAAGGSGSGLNLIYDQTAESCGTILTMRTTESIQGSSSVTTSHCKNIMQNN